MSVLDQPAGEVVWAALDFESAGTAPGRSDEPVQVGLAVWRGGAPDKLFCSYVHSAVRITRAARAVHGIADADVAAAPPLAALWPEFKSRLTGAVVVAHGAGTEKRFLRAFPLHGFGPWLDTLTLSRAMLPDLPDHALSTVLGALGLDDEVREACPQGTWHDALFDAVACLVLLRRMLAWPELSGLRVGQLLNLDAAAYRRQRSWRRTARSAGWSESSPG